LALSFSIALSCGVGCQALFDEIDSFEPIGATEPMPPLVLDYRNGWFHTGAGEETIEDLGRLYRRDAALIARLNQRAAGDAIGRGEAVYIPPVHDITELRVVLERINADPSLAPPIPPPLEYFASLPEPGRAVADARPVASAPRRAPPPTPNPTPARPAPPAAGGSAFLWPAQGRILRGYSEAEGRAHRGIAIEVEPRSPIVASRDGRVIFAGELKGYGRAVILEHGDGYFTVYAYAESVEVRREQVVRAGQTLARAGRPTRTSPAQVFFQIRINARSVDPARYLPRAGAR
jgi:murein DD-endopeptidase MepM/ murein hydrolase activator NlpD